MKPKDAQVIGNELAIRWEDDTESFLSLEMLRRHCPCAACAGETDIMGHVYKGAAQTLGPPAFQIARLESVGGYALKPIWADGHSTGLYSFDYLRRLAAEP